MLLAVRELFYTILMYKCVVNGEVCNITECA